MRRLFHILLENLVIQQPNVNKASLQNSTVKAFLKSYMNNARKLVPQTGYAPLTEEMYQENIDRIEAAAK